VGSKFFSLKVMYTRVNLLLIICGYMAFLPISLFEKRRTLALYYNTFLSLAIIMADYSCL